MGFFFNLSYGAIAIKYINYICVSELSNGNHAPVITASKPMSAIYPFDEDSSPSG